MNDYDPKRPIRDRMDYGHATALIATLERYEEIPGNGRTGQAPAAVRQLEDSDWACNMCGTTMRVTRDVWPKETACEHHFGDYGIVASVTPPVCQRPAERLTRQQSIALAVLADEGPMGAGNLWNWQVRPWPVLENLVAKGLAVSGDWLGSEDEYEYTITPLGREVAARLADQRKAPR